MRKMDKKINFLFDKVKEEIEFVKNLSDFELRNKTIEFKKRLNEIN